MKGSKNPNCVRVIYWVATIISFLERITHTCPAFFLETMRWWDIICHRQTIFRFEPTVLGHPGHYAASFLLVRRYFQPVTQPMPFAIISDPLHADCSQAKKGPCRPVCRPCTNSRASFLVKISLLSNTSSLASERSSLGLKAPAYPVKAQLGEEDSRGGGFFLIFYKQCDH